MASERGAGGTIIAGRNPVREALERDDSTLEKVFVQRGLQGGGLEVIQKLARSAHVPVQYVPQGRLDQMAGGAAHQGVLAIAAPVPYLDVDEMLSGIAPALEDVQALKPIVLVLDEIQDPYNFGAILRSAVAAGVSGIIVPERNMAPLSATAVKASAGTALRIPIARASSLVQVIIQMKERGYWVFGADAEGDETMWSADWDRPLVLVIGSEGRGLRPSVRERCDYLVSIPIRGPVDSLNASVAAGILLFAATRGRP